MYFCTLVNQLKPTIKMRKVVSMLMIAALATAVVACGPSKKEKEEEAARIEQARVDSIAAVEAAAAEAAALEAAAAEAARIEQARQDSIAAAEAAAKSAKPKAPAKPKTEPAVKAGQGRG